MTTQALSGKHALVGGASQGIGAATARALAARGASVTLVARDRNRLEAILSELDTSHGAEHRTLPLDLAEPESAGRAVSELADRQPIQIFVHNTGGPPAGPLRDARPEALRAAFEQHVVAGQCLLQAVLPGMEEARYGRIINVISTSVKQPIPGLGVSNTIRGAVANWAKTLSIELGPLGITVNNVLPGFTDTPRLEALIAGKAANGVQSEDEVADAMRAGVPVGRFAQPDETAAAIAFLASPAASYINGINLPVDGGRTGSL